MAGGAKAAPVSDRQQWDPDLAHIGSEGLVERVVQDMLSAIAVKYNLKEKGLDPASVPPFFVRLYDYAWFVGFAIAFVVYLALRTFRKVTSDT